MRTRAPSPQLVEGGRDLVEIGVAAHHQGHPLGGKPGAWTSSATLPMRVGGRLSITNHPRSSNASAACDRPAPDTPR